MDAYTLMANFETAHWDEWSSQIIDTYGLKRTARDEYHGGCPACGGDDRFWINPHQGVVKVHCRVCNDFRAIQERMHEDGCWPSLQPIRDNVVQLQQEDFPVHTDGTPYHTRKGVELFNAVLQGNTVIVPLYNFEKKPVGEQTIDPAGKKKFNAGLDKSQGVFGVCGRLEEGLCYVAEGWATSASVALATGSPCVFALDANNLPFVCEKLQEHFPQLELIVAADNDEKGIAAAKKTNLRWTAPKEQNADWNDVWVAKGRDAVLAGLAVIKSSIPAKPLFLPIDQIKPKPPQWLISDVLEQDTLAIIFGASGTYKTFVAIDMALSVATGKDHHGRFVKQGAVAYIAGEGNHGFGRRTQAWSIHHGVDLKGVPFLKSTSAITLSDESIEEITSEMDAAQELYGKLDLICLDTLDRTIDGVEDDNSDTKKYLDFCDALRTRYSCTILIVAHTGHAAPNRAKGSTKLKDRMDASYQVKSTGTTVQLINRKMKDAEELPTQTYLRISIDIPVEDGEDTDSLVLDLIQQNAQEGLSRERINDIIIAEFNRHCENGSMKRSDLKPLVAMETEMSSRNVDRYIKDLINDGVFTLAGGVLHQGDNFDQTAF